jgi:hypothetical protein
LGYESRFGFGSSGAPTNSIFSLNKNYTEDPSNANEVVAFTQGQLPQYIYALWTPGSDEINVNFASPVTLPIKFWDVSSSPRIARFVEEVSLAYARAKYYQWNSGIDVEAMAGSGVESISGAPFNVLAPSTLGTTGCEDLAPGGVLANYHPTGVLNVYITDLITANGSPYFDAVGISCGGAIIITTSASMDVLAHEIGHELALLHTADNVSGVPYTGFTESDLMDPSTLVPKPYLTTGQVFRTVFDGRSLLNGGGGIRAVERTPATLPDVFVPALRSAPPAFACDPYLGSMNPNNSCPAACKDLWGVGPGTCSE